MGLRFRRSLKLLPGVRLNVGKRGLSVSLGPRGARLTVGPSGTRATVGIPGTGLSYTEKLEADAAAQPVRRAAGKFAWLALAVVILLLIGALLAVL